MTLKFLAKAGILAALLYAGGILGHPYYQYLMMKYAVEEAADIGLAQVQLRRGGRSRDDWIMRDVAGKVTEVIRDQATWLGLDVPADSVQVHLEPDLFRVATTWETEARLPAYSHKFHFHVEGRRVLTR